MTVRSSLSVPALSDGRRYRYMEVWQRLMVTLSDLMDAGKLLWVYCCDCGRERDIDPASLPLPPAFPVPVVGSRMKCSACGSRKINTKPELWDRGHMRQTRRHQNSREIARQHRTDE